MTNKEKKEAVLKLMFEITASQSLGNRCANIMEVEEHELYDIVNYVKHSLNKDTE